MIFTGNIISLLKMAPTDASDGAVTISRDTVHVTLKLLARDL